MLSSQQHIIQQARAFLLNISDNDYSRVMRPQFSGSAGQHMRHVLDHYLALRAGVVTGLVDYDRRRRGCESEASVARALQVLDEIERWLPQVCTEDPSTPVNVKSEVSLTETRSMVVTSSIGRELMFAASHAVHHFSQMALIRSLQGKAIETDFGVAPATKTYLKSVG